MNQQRYHHGFMTGRCLRLCLALGLGLALGTQIAAAKECQRETPLIVRRGERDNRKRLRNPGPHAPPASPGDRLPWPYS
jgi:hypothetical protein